MIYLFYFILFFIIIIIFFFLYSTYRLNLAHIDIPYAKGYSKLLITGMSENENGRAIFLYATQNLNLIHIAIKFHQDIPYGYLVMACRDSVKTSNQMEVTQRVRK